MTRGEPTRRQIYFSLLLSSALSVAASYGAWLNFGAPAEESLTRIDGFVTHLTYENRSIPVRFTLYGRASDFSYASWWPRAQDLKQRLHAGSEVAVWVDDPNGHNLWRIDVDGETFAGIDDFRRARSRNGWVAAALAALFGFSAVYFLRKLSQQRAPGSP
jgi:hypothetical protein